jgi:hypothetical protein
MEPQNFSQFLTDLATGTIRISDIDLEGNIDDLKKSLLPFIPKHYEESWDSGMIQCLAFSRLMEHTQPALESMLALVAELRGVAITAYWLGRRDERLEGMWRRSVSQQESACAKLLTEMGSDLCNRLSVESIEWDRLIVPALIEFDGVVIPKVYHEPAKFGNVFRCLAEAIFAAGWKRGQLDSKMVKFVVAEEDKGMLGGVEMKGEGG